MYIYNIYIIYILLAKNGSSKLKQLALITFLLLIYIYIYIFLALALVQVNTTTTKVARTSNEIS